MADEPVSTGRLVTVQREHRHAQEGAGSLRGRFHAKEMKPEEKKKKKTAQRSSCVIDELVKLLQLIRTAGSETGSGTESVFEVLTCS